jgi:hypothetical protein
MSLGSAACVGVRLKTVDRPPQCDRKIAIQVHRPLEQIAVADVRFR